VGPVLTGELVLAYRLDERIPLVRGTASRHVERWTVSVLLDRSAGRDPQLEIGYAHVLVFTLEPGRDIGDLVDPASGTWIDVERRPGAAGLPADPGVAPGRNGHVLLLDRVWVDPDHRHRGLGPIVAAAVIGRLGRGCHLAACYPAPFEAGSDQPEDRARRVEALGRVWSKVGFRHWRDGVWMLDLSTTDMEATLADLVAARQDGQASPRA
jgi:GNAT superfamily N-acetyltransferase